MSAWLPPAFCLPCFFHLSLNLPLRPSPFRSPGSHRRRSYRDGRLRFSLPPPASALLTLHGCGRTNSRPRERKPPSPLRGLGKSGAIARESEPGHVEDDAGLPAWPPQLHLPHP